MATQEDINRHDELMADLADEFAAGLSPLFVALFDQLLTMQSPTRIQIQAQFQPIRQYAQAQIQQINSVITDAVEMNSDTLPDAVEPDVQTEIQRLQSEAEAQVAAQIDAEQNRIIEAVMLALIAGGVAAAVSQLRLETPAFIRRLRLSFDTAVRSVDGAVTVLRGRKREVRYRYSGGVVAESRDFCRQMNGRTLTETEIRRIWSTQDWAGKRVGDPYVVRGGYNCRHQFIPVAPDED